MCEDIRNLTIAATHAIRWGVVSVSIEPFSCLLGALASWREILFAWIRFGGALRFAAILGLVWRVSAETIPPPPLLLVPRADTPAEVAASVSHKWVRSRPVAIDPAVLDGIQTGGVQRLEFQTFDGESHVLVLASRVSAFAGGGTWSGDIEGIFGSSAHLVVSEGMLSLGVNIPKRRPYTLRSTGPGNYRLCEVNLAAGTPSAGTSPGVLEPIPRGKLAATPEHRGAGLADSPILYGTTYVDVMILYTPASRNAAGGATAIRNEAMKALNLANDAHSRSSTGIQLRLVALSEYAYTEKSSISSDLDAVNADSSVAALANAYGADLVAVFVERTGGSNGIGYRPTKVAEVPGSYCVLKWDHAYSGLTFAHETGHNFGCGHDVGHGDGIFPYSHGYAMPPSFPIYRTIMADDDTGFVTRVPHFSNPRIKYVDSLGVSYTTGDGATADNVRTIFENRVLARNHRSPKNAFYTYPVYITFPIEFPPFGDASPYSPASHLSILFNRPSGKDIVPGLIYLTGFDETVPATIYMDSKSPYAEKIRITRACRLEKGSGSGKVRIGPN